MGRPINIKETDPLHYQRTREAQNIVRQRYFNDIKIARLCPYCGHKVEILCRGEHASSSTVCSKCGEEVFFPPVMFRIA